MSLCGSCEKRAGRFQCAHCALVYCSAQCARIGLGANDDIVGLEANDGTRVEITIEQAREMGTMANLLEDSGPEDYIPLSQIDGATIRLIKRALDQESLGVLDNDTYSKLIMAANYLDFKRLLRILLPELHRRNIEVPPQLNFLALFFIYDRDDLIQFAYRTGLEMDANGILHRGYIDLNRSFQYAAGKGYLDIVQLLLPVEGVDPAANESNAIRSAAWNGHANVVRLLMDDKRSNPADLKNSTIRRAAINGHDEVVRLLLADPRVDPTEALFSAVRNGHAKVVRVLLADPRVDLTGAIRTAAEFDTIEVARVLLADSRVDPNDGLKSAKSTKMLELLLDDPRVDIDAIDDPEIHKFFQKRRKIGQILLYK